MVAKCFYKIFSILWSFTRKLMIICMWTHVTSHNPRKVDHIRLSFFQIRVEKLERGPSGFQFFACFMMFLTSSDLGTNHSAVLWVRRGPPGCAWVVLICSLDTRSYTTKNRVLKKRQSYMVNLCLTAWRQRDSTCVPSSCCLRYVFGVKYLTTNDIQQLILLQIEHLMFFHLMLVLVEQIFIV